MKIKVFTKGNTVDLADAVNEFIKELDDSEVVDIKFTESESTLSAMVIYKSIDPKQCKL